MNSSLFGTLEIFGNAFSNSGNEAAEAQAAIVFHDAGRVVVKAAIFTVLQQ